MRFNSGFKGLKSCVTAGDATLRYLK